MVPDQWRCSERRLSTAKASQLLEVVSLSITHDSDPGPPLMPHIVAFVNAYAASEIAAAIRANIRSVTQPGCMHALTSELVNEASPVSVRDAAGLAQENTLLMYVAPSPPFSGLPVSFFAHISTGCAVLSRAAGVRTIHSAGYIHAERNAEA
jgi:hypothetical protein